MVRSKNPAKSQSKALSINHPNSRKAARLSRQVIKETARTKSKLHHAIKRNLFGEKLIWFKNRLDPSLVVYNGEQFDAMIQQYLARFDEEVEQINLKRSISKGRAHQHAGRADAIKITQEKELGEYLGAGIEMVDILDYKTLEKFREWDGKFGRLEQMTIKRFNKNFLASVKPQQLPKRIIAKQEALTGNTEGDNEMNIEENVINQNEETTPYIGFLIYFNPISKTPAYK